MARKTSTPLAPGSCRMTKTGRKYCNIPNHGVRFVKETLKGLGQPTGRHCIRFKTVTIKSGPQKGQKVDRCAEFAGTLAQPTGKHCVKWHPATAKHGRRCARYA